MQRTLTRAWPVVLIDKRAPLRQQTVRSSKQAV
jgi:hypothetical protein